LAAALSGVACPASEPAKDRTNAERIERWRRVDLALCEKLLPADLRERFLRGGVLSVGEKAVFGGVTCHILKIGSTAESLLFGGGRGAVVSYLCSPGITSPEKMQAAVADYSSGKQVPGIGRLALSWDGVQVKFWDSDTDCNVDVIWRLEARQLLPFATEVERLLTPALAKNVESSSLQ
jgi:hypothetical protein